MSTLARPRIFLLPLLASLLLAACSKPAPAPEPLRSVKVITVGASATSTGLEFSGEVRARTESRLGFRVGGKLLQRQADIGQAVKAGQLLAQLDPQDYQLAQDAARAQVAAAQTQRDLAAADLKRFQALRDQNFISSAEIERRDATLQAAQAQLEQAQAQLASQGNQAAYTRLTAPAAGVVTAVEAEPGQVLAAGTPVLRLALDGPRDVVFAVPEDRVAAMRVGAAVRIKPWGQDTGWDKALSGQVREVAASADPVTRTFQVKVTLPTQAKLALGTTVSVAPQALARGAGEGPAVIKLPTSALRQEGGATAVWVLDAATMTVKSQPVQLGGADGNEAIVTSGLQAGMQVVAAGVHVLQPGQKVTLWLPPGQQAPVSGPVPASASASAASVASAGAKP